MISAKEAREISKKNKEFLTEVAIVEVLPEIEEFIKISIPLLLAEFHQYNLNHNMQDLVAMEKIIIFLFLIIYNIKEKEKIKILFKYNDSIIIKTLKEILIFYKVLYRTCVRFFSVV